MEYVEVARAESPRGEVVLRERRDENAPTILELRVNGVFVMDTLETTTERALANRALELSPDPRNVLVGGLGLGFTAHEVLGDPRVERVDVVEIEDALIDWMRDGTIAHGPALLADQRFHVVHADFRQAVAETVGPTYDLVLLDVDNGPEYLVHEANAALYEEDFLRAVREILTPNGALVVWAANPAPELQLRMHAVFGQCAEIELPVALQDRDETYLIYLAQVAAR